jgi:CheY-like chemotaxis protein
VAKILVADDNSNVQKTVALALADLGVEVVAVNNGDAAIRKLADIAPDLVLADIFMPVRNGYEVCEYVKKDTRFSSVPVVLLVGAFDPLDEREAQRVGADGILKKPFVPPDPLMTMVKTLLDRAMGDRLVSVAASKPAAVAQEKAGGVATAVQPPPRPEPVEEEPEEEIPPPVDRLSFGEGERPIAFGQLLDTPAKDSEETESEVLDPVDDEQILTSSRDASLGEPAFWKKEEPEEDSDEEAAEEEDSDSEDEVGISAGTAARAWKPDKEAKSGEESGEEEDDVVQPVIDPFELVRDQDDAGHSSAVVVSSASILQDAASQAPLTVDSGKAPDLAANPIEWMATAPAHQVEEATEETAEETQEETPEWSAAETEPAEEEVEAEESEHLESAPEPVVEEFSVPVAPALPVPPVISMPSPPPPVMAPAPPRAAQPAQAAQPPAKTGAEIPSTMKTQPSLRPAAQGPEDTARSIPKTDWADLASGLQTKPAEPVAEKPKPAPVAASMPPAAPPAAISQPAPAIAAGTAEPDPALVEAVVQRILDKMRPQVVDIITKEFLRPIVQALVHREIEKH